MNAVRQFGVLVCGLLLSVIPTFAQPGGDLPHSASSVSGQFVVSAVDGISRLAWSPEIATNPAWLRLEPMLTAVSAERVKQALAKELQVPANAGWRSKVFMVLRPAQSLTEGVSIQVQPFLQVWQYRVELPNLLSAQRFTRTIAAVLLIQLAGLEPATGRTPEIPAWLADGLAQQILAVDTTKLTLSAPTKAIDGLVQSRQNANVRGVDGLAGVRETLRNASVLTFQQLSWPEPAQLAGADGGVYFASAQLFTSELLQLKNGPAKLRAMLARLPACANWQTAFFAAFQDDFSRPLEVEKWWSLRVVNFSRREVGPRWTPAASGARLAELLSVSVAVRHVANALPVHEEISLQAALRSLTPAQQLEVLRVKLRDLELAQLRFAPVYAVVADGYRRALADYLGERKPLPLAADKPGKQPPPRRASVGETVKKLNALDLRRRAVDEQVNGLIRRLR